MGGGRAGTRPACRGRGVGRGVALPQALGLHSGAGSGSVQARETLPLLRTPLRAWAPSGLPSTRRDSVSVPAAPAARGSRPMNLYGLPAEEPVGGLGGPRGAGGDADHTPFAEAAAQPRGLPPAQPLGTA